MIAYRWRAVDAEGRIATGELAAPGRPALEAALARRGLELLGARELRGRRRRALSRPALIDLLVQLEQMLAAGLPLQDVLADLARGKGPGPALAGGLADAIARGSALSAALAAMPGAISPVLISLIRAGETTGDLAAVLRHALRELRWQDEQAALTRRLLLYPAILSAVLGLTLGFLLLVVVPQLGGFLTGLGQRLPLQTQLLLACSAALGRWGIYLPPALAVGGAGWWLALQRHAGFARWCDAVLLRLPVLGPVLINLALTRICEVFGLLYAAGIAVPEALRAATAVTANRALRAALGHAGERLDAGQSISASFAGLALLPPLLLRMIAVGEQTGRLDAALAHVAAILGRRAREAVERLQTLLLPGLVGVLGLVVLWIVWAVFGPLYDLLGTLRM